MKLCGEFSLACLLLICIQCSAKKYDSLGINPLKGSWYYMDEHSNYTEIHILDDYFITYDSFFGARIKQFELKKELIKLKNPGSNKVVLVVTVISVDDNSATFNLNDKMVKLNKLKINIEMLKIVNGDENEFRKYHEEFKKRESANLVLKE
jgi:hypothetical protein